MASVYFTNAAEQDLEEIADYIAQDNAWAALSVVKEVRKTCYLFSDNSRLGKERSDIAEGLRHFPSGKYLILYRLVGEDVEIVRVVHGARNLVDLF